MEKYINTKDLIVIGLDNPDCEHQLKFVPWEFIEDLPGEDVEKVKHGKWCGVGNNDTVFTCSNCRAMKRLKCHVPTCTIIFPKYCEECGAKMDKE